MGRISESAEPTRFIVEVRERPVGIAVEDPAGFCFHACADEVWPLDRMRYPTLRAIERAAQRLILKSDPRNAA